MNLLVSEEQPTNSQYESEFNYQHLFTSFPQFESG